jgi:hypothetical protein
MVVQSLGALPLLAANGSVRGRLAIEGGSAPPGAIVRATPLDGGQPVTTALNADNTYEFPALKEGAYLFEVIGSEGRPLGAGTRTLVPPGVLQLNLKVRMQPAAAPPVMTRPVAPPKPAPVEPAAPAPSAPRVAAPPAEPPPGTEVAEAADQSGQPSTGMSKKKKWAVIGVIIGSLGVGAAVGHKDKKPKKPKCKDKDQDENGSPSCDDDNG